MFARTPPRSGILNFDQPSVAIQTRFFHTIDFAFGGGFLFSKIPFRRIVHFTLIISLVLVITACNHKDDGISPSSPQNTGFSGAPSISAIGKTPLPYPFATLKSVSSSKIRTSVISDPNGPNLLSLGADSWYGMAYVPVTDPRLLYLTDGDLTTGVWVTYPPENEGGGYFSSWWRYPQKISRIFAVTGQQVQTVQFVYWDDANNKAVWCVPETFGPNVDINFNPPITTSFAELCFISPIDKTGIYEIGLYGPSSAVVKITSPANGARFMIGENIQFTSTANVSLINYQWTYDGIVLGTSPGSSNTTASYLAPGTHTIRITAQETSDLSLVSDSITIVVEDIAKIKIKNLDAQSGEDPFLTSTSVSYRAAKTRFQAIGCRADDTEICPISVNWELIGGDVLASEQLRLGILAKLGELGAYNTKIGSINGVATVTDTSMVTFNSFLPGNIALVAKKGSVSASVSIRIKQPTVYISVKYLAAFPHLPVFIIPTWVGEAKSIWGQENLINIKEYISPFLINNEVYQPLSQDQSGEYLFTLKEPPQFPSFLNPIVTDAIADKYYGISLLNVVPRQTEELLKRRVTNRNVVNVFVSDPYCDVIFKTTGTKEIAKLEDNYGGIAISSLAHSKKTHESIIDKDEAGIILPNIKAFQISSELRETEVTMLAHELGHILLKAGHLWDTTPPTPSNVMDSLSSGRIVESAQFRNILDYDKTKDPNSFFIVEE